MLRAICSFKYYINSFRKIRVALPGQGAAAARAALPVPFIASSVFVRPNNGIARFSEAGLLE